MRAIAYAALTGARRTASAPADAAVQVGLMLLVVLALASVWHAALGSHHGLLGGYDWRALVWYATFAEASTVPVRRIIEEVGDEIGNGDVSIAMLRPVPVVAMRIAIEMGAALARQAACLAAGCALAAVLVGGPPSWSALILGLVAAPLALAVNTVLQHALGGVAFWARDARSTWFLYQKLILIGGGVLIPLDLLPSGLAAVLQALPFAAVAYVPGRLAAGRGGPSLLAFQVLWLLLGLLAAAVVHNRGQRRLEVVGG